MQQQVLQNVLELYDNKGQELENYQETVLMHSSAGSQVIASKRRQTQTRLQRDTEEEEDTVRNKSPQRLLKKGVYALTERSVK